MRVLHRITAVDRASLGQWGKGGKPREADLKPVWAIHWSSNLDALLNLSQPSLPLQASLWCLVCGRHCDDTGSRTVSNAQSLFSCRWLSSREGSRSTTSFRITPHGAAEGVKGMKPGAQQKLVRWVTELTKAGGEVRLEWGDGSYALRTGTLSPHFLCLDSPSRGLMFSLNATLPTLRLRQGNDFATGMRLPRRKWDWGVARIQGVTVPHYFPFNIKIHSLLKRYTKIWRNSKWFTSYYPIEIF